jgi:Predicted phosphatase homologous to the C-terminal domain of histone macroH2A1
MKRCDKIAAMILEKYLNGRVIIKVGDITAESVDAIVNAANSTLLGGGGVDGAIHAKGGGALLEECREIRRTQYPKGLPTGEAVITTAGNLPSRYVIHTVGPIYGHHDGKEAELLAACYQNSLGLAVENNLKTIAFPAISTGVYVYPKDEAAKVASVAISEFLSGNDQIAEVRLVFFGEADAKKFIKHREF